MKTKTKTFDCVEMKERIQRELMSEYEARKGEFSSYAEFITATASSDPQIQAFRGRIAREKGGRQDRR